MLKFSRSSQISVQIRALKRPLFKILVCVLVLFHYACTEDEVADKVFKYNQINPITSLDPAFAKSQNNIWACHHIYNNLVRFDSELNVIPDLAKSWNISENGLVYTFTLKDSIFFHQNECFSGNTAHQLDAKDVVYSLKRLNDPKVKSPGSWLLKDKLADSGIQALDNKTIEIRLQTTFAPFLSLLANQYCAIIPKEAVDFYGARFRSNPVGTGPYKLKRWLENEAMFLSRNTMYFDKKPDAEGIKISFMTDRKMAYLELLNENVDLVSGLESSFLHKLLDKEGNLRTENEAAIDFVKSPYLNTEYIGMNYQKPDAHPLLKEKRFRQALNFGLDKKLMLQTLRSNVGQAANKGIIPAGLPSHAYTPEGYSFNRSKALSLINQLQSEGFSIDEPITISTNADYLDLVTFAAKQWESLGLTCNIDVFESAILRENMRAGTVDMFRASWIADYPDGENFLCLFYGDNPAPPNYTRYSNPKFDTLYKKASSTTDNAERFLMYAELEKMIIEDAPVIFLFYDQSSIFTSKKVAHLETNALNLLELEKLNLNY